MNEGSRAPDYASGPVWAIFDSAAVKRGGWPIRYPYIADPPDGYFHKADTLAELAKKVMGHPHQKMPLKYLEATVARYNALADKGKDEDFEKPVMHRIDTPPFYAATAPIRDERFLRRSAGSTARRRSWTRRARSSPASTPAARPAAAVRSTASAAPRSTATSPARTRRRSRRCELGLRRRARQPDYSAFSSWCSRAMRSWPLAWLLIL